MSANTQDLKERFTEFTNVATLGELFAMVNNGNRHSFGNNILKIFQARFNGVKEFKNVTMGYDQWAKRGVHVNKGEKAMYIWAPVYAKQVRVKDEETGEVKFKGIGGIKYFTMVPVFDVSQTGGYNSWLENRAKFEEKVFSKGFPMEIAEKLALATGIPFEKREAVDGARGEYNTVNLSIWYSDANSLIHEIGHHLTIDKSKSYPWNECAAEMVCLYLCNAYRVEFNMNYSKIWGSRIADLSEKFDYTKFQALYRECGKKVEDLLEKAGLKLEAVMAD